jgi:plastocyanin
MMAKGLRRLPIAAAVVLAAACGGSGGTTQSPSNTGGGAGAQTATITISAAGVATPKIVTVAQGSQVTFVNNDSISHQMFSDPHPEHTDCPELDQVGYLAPGQNRQSGNLNIVRSCGFHDHGLPLVTSLQGTIVIQ